MSSGKGGKYRNLGGDDHDGGGGHDDESIWLVSYADLMSLLFTFFVVLYAAAANKGEFNKAIRQNLSSYFEGTPESESKDIVEFGKERVGGIDGTGVNKKRPNSQGYKDEGKQLARMQKLEKTVLRQIGSKSLQYDVETNATMEGMEITFSSIALFDSGKATLRGESRSLFFKMAKVIAKAAPNHFLKVEGHTDPQPVSTTCFPSNWELSSARAASIIRIFEMSGFSPKYLTAIGYGATRPKFPNKSAAGEPILVNMARNRRVIVTILAPKTSQSREPAASQKGAERI